MSHSGIPSLARAATLYDLCEAAQLRTCMYPVQMLCRQARERARLVPGPPGPSPRRRRAGAQCAGGPASPGQRSPYGQSPHSTKILDFRGFDSSIISILLRGGILMSIGNCLEKMSQAILAVTTLVGRLGVRAKVALRKRSEEGPRFPGNSFGRGWGLRLEGDFTSSPLPLHLSMALLLDLLDPSLEVRLEASALCVA